MSRQKFYDASEAIKFLGRNGISVTDRKISLKKGKVGLKCWSAVDYLTNYCKHVIGTPM